MNKLALIVGVVIMAVMVQGHSWMDLPACRYASTSRDYCMMYDNGTQVLPAVCGKDAQGADLMLLRPTSYQRSPCFYDAAYTYNNAPTAVISVDNMTLCVMWGANAHNTDPTRNAGGGVRLSITSNVDDPTQAEFDQMVVARIPYENFGGVKVQLPSLPVGEYLLQFYWDWPTPSREHLFISCSNLSILASGDSRLVSQQSQQYGMGLPKDFRPDTGSWKCNPSDLLYSNSSIVTTTTTTTAKSSTTSTTTSKSTTTTSQSTATTSQSSATPIPTSTNTGNPSPSDASFVGVFVYLLFICAFFVVL